MAQLGAAKTGTFVIGQFEVRIGTLEQAGILTSAQSIGVVDSYSWGLNLATADLKAGFPRKLLDRAITEIDGELTFTGREYSARNMSTLLGNAVANYPAAGGDYIAVVGTATGGVTAGATSFVVSGASGSITGGNTVTIFSVTDPTKVTVAPTTGVTGGVMGLATGFSVLDTYTVDEDVRVSLSNVISGGNLLGVNYFSAQLVSVDRPTSRPIVVDFWKCAVAQGLKVSNSGTEFSSQEWSVGVLFPTTADYATGGPLDHLSSIIPTNPILRMSTPVDFR